MRQAHLFPDTFDRIHDQQTATGNFNKEASMIMIETTRSKLYK